MSQESLLEGGVLSWTKEDEEEFAKVGGGGHSSQKGDRSPGSECKTQIPRWEVSDCVGNLVP